MPAINVFSAENLSKRYGERLLFEGLTFGLSRGQKCAIVAKNGTGKTTLLNRGELVVGSVSLGLGGYLSWQGITGLALR